MIFAIYLIVGALAGLSAGLFGIGGGLIIVPLLIFSFKLQGLAPEVLTHLAVGTSLATIVLTSLSSSYTHYKKKAILWPVFTLLTVGMLLGAWAGAYGAAHLSGVVLQRVLGAFALIIAVKMWLGFKVAEGKHPPSDPLIVSAGTIIGGMSAILGIGGGSLSVPFLRNCHFKMNEAVATSAVCGFPIALVGSMTNIFTGLNHPMLPPMATGYVYWPAFTGIVLTSIVFARLGARLAHRLSETMLQRLFALMLTCVGVEFLLSV